jgi:hypothetical protein
MKLVPDSLVLLALLAVLLAATHLAAAASTRHQHTRSSTMEGPLLHASQGALAFDSKQMNAGRKLMEYTVPVPKGPTFGVLVTAKLWYKGKNLFDRAEAAQVTGPGEQWEVPAATAESCGNIKTGNGNNIPIGIIYSPDGVADGQCEWMVAAMQFFVAHKCCAVI